MSIAALGYIGVHSSKLDDWSDLATRLLGMQQIDRAGATRVFRMDDRKQRFVVTGEGGDRLAFMGWETPDAAAMDALAGRLEGHGVQVSRATRALADQRGDRVKAYLAAKLPPERVLLTASKLGAEGIDDKGRTTRVGFAVK